jgi:hypothetical protein
VAVAEQTSSREFRKKERHPGNHDEVPDIRFANSAKKNVIPEITK